MSRDFDGAHRSSRWRPVRSRLANRPSFSRFIENQTTVYSKFDKKRFTEPCRVSTVQFMAAVRVEEPKVSEFSRCLCLRMMHKEDGVTSG